MIHSRVLIRFGNGKTEPKPKPKKKRKTRNLVAFAVVIERFTHGCVYPRKHLSSLIIFDELKVSPNAGRFRVSDECDLSVSNQFANSVLLRFTLS